MLYEEESKGLDCNKALWEILRWTCQWARYVDNNSSTCGVSAQQTNSSCILRFTTKRELSTVGTVVL
jgi:hypothetical protein